MKEEGGKLLAGWRGRTRGTKLELQSCVVRRTLRGYPPFHTWLHLGFQNNELSNGST